MLKIPDSGYFYVELSEDERLWVETLTKDVRTTLFQLEIEDDRKIIFLALELAYKKGRWEQWKDSKSLLTNTAMQ